MESVLWISRAFSFRALVFSGTVKNSWVGAESQILRPQWCQVPPRPVHCAGYHGFLPSPSPGHIFTAAQTVCISSCELTSQGLPAKKGKFVMRQPPQLPTAPSALPPARMAIRGCQRGTGARRPVKEKLIMTSALSIVRMWSMNAADGVVDTECGMRRDGCTMKKKLA